MTVLLLSRIFRVAGIYRRFRLIGIRACGGRGRAVLDAAIQDIRFGNSVLDSKLFTITRCQAVDGPVITGQYILNSNTRECQVAIVLSSDLVSDRIAQLVAAFRSLGGRFLSDGQVTIRLLKCLFLSADGSISCLGEIADLRGNGICKAARQNIRLGDHIGRRCLNGLTRPNIFKDALLQRYAFDLNKGDRPGCIVNVGRCDDEGDGIAKLVDLRLADGLGYDKII